MITTIEDNGNKTDEINGSEVTETKRAGINPNNGMLMANGGDGAVPGSTVLRALSPHVIKNLAQLTD